MLGLVPWLAGGRLLLLRDFWPYCIIFMTCVAVVINAVSSFWDLWDNIYDRVCLLL